MARPIRDRLRLVSAWALSLAAHVGLTAGGLAVAHYASMRTAAVAAPSVAAAGPTGSAWIVVVELPPMVLGPVGDAKPPTSTAAAAPPRGGGESMPRPDMGRRGRGGTNMSEAPAMNLADQDDAILLGDAALSRIDRSQVQRIRTSRERAARENYRASREPLELTFLAEGFAGTRPERRPPADSDPSAGASSRGAPSVQGSSLGAAELPLGVGERAREPGGETLGTARASDGLGVRDGRPGFDHRASAAVPHARPQTEEGTPSVPAIRGGKPSDTLDSEQEVATRMQSILHASTAGGAAGPGLGGQQRPGARGSGGTSGPGSRARALGTGLGAGLDNAPSDPRRLGYERGVRAKIHPLWANAFPKWAIAEGRQGTVVVTLAIRADGSLASAVVSRPSGIPEFDANCRQAVERASPFGALPPVLGSSFRIAMAFDARNPAVKPRAAGHEAREP